MPADGAVLVTGGAGYVGSHVVWALVEAGYRVVVLDDLSTGFRDAVAAEVEFVDGDLSDRDLVDKLIAEQSVTAVVHLAASVVVSESVAQSLAYYDNNTVKSRDLLAACLGGGVKAFVFSSTAAVYGAPDVQPVTEDAPTLPINPYSRSKLMTEWMLGDAAAISDLRFIALRYFNVAGANPAGRIGQRTANATHLIKLASETAVGVRNHIDVFGEDYPTPDGTCVGDYIHVADISSAHVAKVQGVESDQPADR